jgi:hypothetical protein
VKNKLGYFDVKNIDRIFAASKNSNIDVGDILKINKIDISSQRLGTLEKLSVLNAKTKKEFEKNKIVGIITKEGKKLYYSKEYEHMFDILKNQYGIEDEIANKIVIFCAEWGLPIDAIMPFIQTPFRVGDSKQLIEVISGNKKDA